MERLRNVNAGLGQYCFQLGRALADQSGGLAGRLECYLPEHLAGILGPGFSYRASRKWHKLTGIETDAALWHCMHQESSYLPRGNKTALAMTIHDLNFLARKDYPNWRKGLKTRQLQKRIERCKGLVYISEFVRTEVHNNLKVPAGMQEKVIYNGVKIERTPGQGSLKTSGPYLFSIGLHPKKNYAVALPILNRYPEYRWVIAGADDKGYRSELEMEAHRQGVAERVSFTGTVTEEEKWRLYEHCTAMIFPSLSEGFGLPVLEAMAFGKPVFLSDRTSLPEIGGTEAYYFKNFTPEHVQQVFSEGMNNYKNDPAKPQRLKKHTEKFTWDNAASAYLQFYQSILDG